MRHLIPLLFLLATSTSLACESGWDIDGRVLTAGVQDRDRSLAVYMLDLTVIDPAHLPTDSLAYNLLAQADQLPSQELPFTHSEFGCHRGSVAIVAWAPKRSRAGADAGVEASALDGRPRPFTPAPGDMIAVSDVHHPYCGPRTVREHIDVTLPATPVAATPP
jgi:hypothetical protein